MDDQRIISEKPFRCGFVAIIGPPNVGKSTLMNGLVGQKLSIVTSKPQTTRHKVLGILSTERFQAIFLDTPGLVTPRYLLQEAMMRSASSALDDADVVLAMIDATAVRPEGEILDEGLGVKLRGLSKPVFLAINKIDAVRKISLLPLIDACAKAYEFKEIFLISALHLDGTNRLLEAVVQSLPDHPSLYPPEMVSEQSERFFVSEIVREKVFEYCREEVPYSTTVDIVEFKERDAGKTFVSADITVERDSQKGIVIGRRGAMLREIGQAARVDIETLLQHPVFLELHVKVRPRWRSDPQWLRRLGYKELPER